MRKVCSTSTNELSFVTVEPFGQTGPPFDSNRYTTFLVTVAPSSFGIQVDEGQEYVFNIIKDLDDTPANGLKLRHSGSALTLPFEDVWFTSNTSPTVVPGYVQTQQGASYHNFASAAPPSSPSKADYNGDGVLAQSSSGIGGADFVRDFFTF